MAQQEMVTARLKHKADEGNNKFVITTILSVNLAIDVTKEEVQQLVETFNQIMEKPINLVELTHMKQLEFGGTK
ncbi:MAG: hypothetical protein LBT80_07975 [Lactobacillaceae bacterium]|jgi:hypothetical protein|nr:hypothetical protein [Lactobacillaceae bacterium]